MNPILASTGEKKESGTRWGWRIMLAMGLVLLGAILNTIYLFHHCPLDLSEDEAHYWEWSRHLDYGYYSKPPGIAWVIWLAIRIGGALGLTGDGSGAALMPVMRMVAVIFGTASGFLSLLLARRMFGDGGRSPLAGEKAALAVIVLSAAVPMFAVGSLLITIDSPMYLCWAATVYCLWRAVEKNSKPKTQNSKRETGAESDHWPLTTEHSWLYAAGFCAAAGMLFKPVGIILPICCAIAALADGKNGPIRRAFKTWHAAGALLMMLASQIPVLIWNAHHGWVMFLHIGGQAGMVTSSAGTASAPQKGLLHALLLDPLSRIATYVGGQAGGMGGILFVLLAIAVFTAWQRSRRRIDGPSIAGSDSPLKPAGENPHDFSTDRTRWIFLLSFTLPLWGFYFLLSFWKGTEINWPAASYFTGMILLGGIAAESWNSPIQKIRNAWRFWCTAAVIWGVLLIAFLMNTIRLYPLAAEHLNPLAGTAAYFSSRWHPKKWDEPAFDKLRGFQARADAVEIIREQMQQQTGDDPLIITGRYDTSSSLSFYLPGHPFAYSLMSNLGGRRSQYDLWPGLNQEQNGAPALAGKSALIIGLDQTDIDKIIRPAFEKVGAPERVPAVVDGITLRMLLVCRAYGFKGHVGSVGAAAY